MLLCFQLKYNSSDLILYLPITKSKFEILLFFSSKKVAKKKKKTRKIEGNQDMKIRKLGNTEKYN